MPSVEYEEKGESEGTENIRQRIELAEQEFASNLETARILWRRYPNLVESPEFPERFLLAYRRRQEDDPDEDIDCWDRILQEHGILPDSGYTI